MKITKKQLRKLVMEEKQKIFLESFARTAQEEAEKINMQTGESYVTDQSFWEKQGITTGEDLAISLLNQTYSDLYKELHGFRPRQKRFETASSAQKAISDLDNAYEEMMEMDRLDIERQTAYEAERAELEELMPGQFDFEQYPAHSGMGRRLESKKVSTEKMLRSLVKEALR